MVITVTDVIAKKTCKKNVLIAIDVSGANQVPDRCVAEKRKSEGLFLKNFDAQMSSKFGITQKAKEGKKRE